MRLSFLSTLLDEAHDYLHHNLCASVLNRKLFRLPFHRDVPISEAGASCIRAFLNHCMQVSVLRVWAWVMWVSRAVQMLLMLGVSTPV